MIIYFITTSTYKFGQFCSSIKIRGVEFKKLKKVIPEIQAKSNGEVAEFSASWAANNYGFPVIKEDVGLYIDALSGFPGPYLSQVEKWIRKEGLLRLMTRIKNRKAYWEYAIAYCEPGRKAVSFSTIQWGVISEKARGKGGYDSDKIFIPNDSNKTIAELIDVGRYVRNDVHYHQLGNYLTLFLGKRKEAARGSAKRPAKFPRYGGLLEGARRWPVLSRGTARALSNWGHNTQGVPYTKLF